MPPAISQASFGQEVLRYGSPDHADVKVLQLELQRLGYGVSVDGYFGTGTLYAVQEFQRAHHLPTDGVVGNLTFVALAQASRTASRGEAAASGAYVVKSGDTLDGIAAKVGVTVSALEAANPHMKPTSLQIGETLVIPSASAKALLPSPSSIGGEIAALALKMGGVRYLWGGSSPHIGFDCSGLVYYIARTLGVNLPRTSSGQFRIGTAVSRTDLQPGDLVFFDTEGYASHVGVYIGDGKFVQAERPGTTVHITSLSAPYWSETYIGARRIYN